MQKQIVPIRKKCIRNIGIESILSKSVIALPETIEIPDTVSIITLGECVLFPQAVMPLYIFEPRYRLMLQDVLAGDRLFAVGCMNPTAASENDDEVPFPVACLGMIRACKKNHDGTSNLILQGLNRIRILETVSNDPYRRIAVSPLTTEIDLSADSIAKKRQELLELMHALRLEGAKIPPELIDFLSKIEPFEPMLDLAIYALCADPAIKQNLLAAISLQKRTLLFLHHLNHQLSELQIISEVKGDLDDDNIASN
jgi:Lon protease-like protein